MNGKPPALLIPAERNTCEPIQTLQVGTAEESAAVIVIKINGRAYVIPTEYAERFEHAIGAAVRQARERSGLILPASLMLPPGAA